jgi:hypothetical protein
MGGHPGTTQAETMHSCNIATHQNIGMITLTTDYSLLVGLTAITVRAALHLLLNYLRQFLLELQ